LCAKRTCILSLGAMCAGMIDELIDG
jgi:hypothetical protein